MYTRLLNFWLNMLLEKFKFNANYYKIVKFLNIYCKLKINILLTDILK